MAKYIEREAAIKAAKHAWAKNLEPSQYIEALPAADVAPVVRCKDCKYIVEATVNSNGFLICHINDMEISPTDFCSYGERKEASDG